MMFRAESPNVPEARLDFLRHAVEKAERFAVLHGLVRQVCTLQRIFCQQGYNRVDLWIDGLDPIEMCLDDFA